MARMMSAGEYDALTRLDFRVFSERVFKTLNPATPFLDNFHVGLITSKLEAVRTGKIRRLIINLPPRNLKSILCSVAFPAFLMARNPSVKIICASYGQDLASSLAADCRQILQESWYRSAFPKTQLVPDRQAVNAFETTAGGMRIATSVGGVLTGFGADTIVIDDPTKPEDALSEAERNRANRWFSNTVVTRLDDQNTGSIVVVMQRLHLDDFTGYLLSLSDWDVVSLPAIAPEDEVHSIETPFGAYRHHRKTGEALHPARESLDVLAEIRRNQGTEHFAAQYLQSPMQPGGNMVKERWFSRYDLSCPPKFDRIVQSWDCAVKAKEFSDYSVCTTWGIQGERYFLLSVLREKLEYPDLKRAVIEQSGLFRATAVLVEDAAAGTQLIQELKRDGSFPVEAVTADKDKLTRLYGQTGMIEAGRVFLPNQASWLDDYLKELMAFPKAKHDDQVDSTSQFLAAMTKPSSFDTWKSLFRRELDEARLGPHPTIRVRHPNPGMTLQTITGRNPPREPAGSFLLTKEEWLSSLIGAGFYELKVE
jgi:predicted phage terminase large subunit-like protein